MQFVEGTPIKTLDDLKAACLQENVSADGVGVVEVTIALAGGIARSTKRVTYYSQEGLWQVYHEISEVWEDDLTDEYMANDVFGEAMAKDALTTISQRR